VRRKAGLLTVVCLSHAEDVAIRATRGISNDYDATVEKSEADYSHFTVFFTLVWNLNGDALENYCSIFKVQSTFDKGLVTLPWIVKNLHSLLYIQ
jgi:hypothetical protein